MHCPSNMGLYVERTRGGRATRDGRSVSFTARLDQLSTNRRADRAFTFLWKERKPTENTISYPSIIMPERHPDIVQTANQQPLISADVDWDHSRVIHTHVWNVKVSFFAEEVLIPIKNRYIFMSQPLNATPNMRFDTQTDKRLRLIIDMHLTDGHRIKVVPPAWIGHRTEFVTSVYCCDQANKMPAFLRCGPTRADLKELRHTGYITDGERQTDCWLRVPSCVREIRVRFTVQYRRRADWTDAQQLRELAALQPRRTWERSKVNGPCSMLVCRQSGSPTDQPSSLPWHSQRWRLKFVLPTLSPQPWRLIAKRIKSKHPTVVGDASQHMQFILDMPGDGYAEDLSALLIEMTCELHPHAVSECRMEGASPQIMQQDESAEDAASAARINPYALDPLYNVPSDPDFPHPNHAVVFLLPLNQLLLRCCSDKHPITVRLHKTDTQIVTLEHVKLMHRTDAQVKEYVDSFRAIAKQRSQTRDMLLVAGAFAERPVPLHVPIIASHTWHYHNWIEDFDVLLFEQSKITAPQTWWKNTRQHHVHRDLMVPMWVDADMTLPMWQALTRDMYVGFLTGTHLTWSLVRGMLRITYQYEMAMMQKACEMWLAQHLDVDNAHEAHEICEMYQCALLKRRLRLFEAAQQRQPPAQRQLAQSDASKIEERLEVQMCRTQLIYARLLNDDELSDMCFACGSRKFYAHEFILSGRAPGLLAFLLGKFRTNQRYELTGLIEARMFWKILEWIYCNWLPMDDDDTMYLYAYAKLWQLTGLQQIAADCVHNEYGQEERAHWTAYMDETAQIVDNHAMQWKPIGLTTVHYDERNGDVPSPLDIGIAIPHEIE